MQIVALALEHRMRLQLDDHVQVARRAAVETGLAFAGEADAIVLVDTGGNLHRQGLVLLDASGAAAGGARLGDDLAVAVTLRTRLLDREEALRDAHLALTLAGGTRLRLSAGLRARAVTRLARLHGRDADLGFRAACR